MYRLFAILLATISLSAEPTQVEVLSFEELRPGCGTKSSYWLMGEQAFNAAPELGVLMAHFKSNYQLTVAVETGTYRGNTTVFLADLFPKVYSIEVNKGYYRNTKKELENKKSLTMINSSSSDILPRLLDKIKEERILFYLDAHWEEDWPLRDELRAIAKTHRDRCVIVIDDFKVPGRDDISYDVYGDKECSYEYIQDLLPEVFSSYKIMYVIPRHAESRAKLIILPS